jgi:hypothetical protein
MTHDPYQPPLVPLESSQSTHARDLGAAQKYVVGATAIGVMQVIDAVILIVNSGVVGSATLVLSTIEFVWAVVSIFALIRLKHPRTRILAIAFIAYNVFGWIVGALAAISSHTEATPMWAVYVGGAFGLAYAVGAAYIFRGRGAA